MDSAAYHYLQLQRHDKILVISLQRPPGNYISAEVFRELIRSRDQMEARDIEAVVLTGTGQVFSKGADLEDLAKGSLSQREEAIHSANQWLNALARMDKPVIAAINGTCLGAGLEIALACHLRLCVERARLGLPELSIGLIPGLGGVERLIRVVGEAKALELILMGDMIPAARAQELHLVNRLYPKEAFMDHVLLFVKTLLAAPAPAIRAVLDLVRKIHASDEETRIREAAMRFLGLAAQKSL